MRLSKLFEYATMAGLVIFTALQCFLLFGSSRTPDPETGRTVALLIAAKISNAPSYVTAPQSWLLAGVGVVLLASFIGWISAALAERLKGAAA
jgi:hypothetical protein